MQSMLPRKVDIYLDLLGKTSNHQDLFTKIRMLNEMQQVFLSVAPPNLAKQCKLSLPINGRLVVFAENGAIATKLKQITPSLLLKIQHLGWEVNSIKIAIQTHQNAPIINKINNKSRRLSSCGIESFSQLAASLPTSTLKTAIESLLKNKS